VLAATPDLVLEPVREPLTDATQPAADTVTQRVPTTI
jgi:hypothetical protein